VVPPHARAKEAKAKEGMSARRYMRALVEQGACRADRGNSRGIDARAMSICAT
jgi:hypothetical protein